APPFLQLKLARAAEVHSDGGRYRSGLTSKLCRFHRAKLGAARRAVSCANRRCGGDRGEERYHRPKMLAREVVGSTQLPAERLRVRGDRHRRFRLGSPCHMWNDGDATASLLLEYAPGLRHRSAGTRVPVLPVEQAAPELTVLVGARHDVRSGRSKHDHFSEEQCQRVCGWPLQNGQGSCDPVQLDRWRLGPVGYPGCVAARAQTALHRRGDAWSPRRFFNLQRKC
ncbi:unnamed protein product, partial [Symbiodinium sp. CCMP2456]